MATIRRRKPASKTTPARRRSKPAVKATPRRRRRSASMASPFSKAAIRTGGKAVIQGAAGGAAAKVLADNIAGRLAPMLGGLAPYSRPITAALGAYLTQTMLKNPTLAAGMAGVAGAELAAALITGTSAPVNDYYIDQAEEIFALPGLSGYQVPMSEQDVYSSGYANQLAGNW